MKLVKKEKRIKILLRIDQSMDIEIAGIALNMERTKSDTIRTMLEDAIELYYSRTVDLKSLFKKEKKSSLKKENI